MSSNAAEENLEFEFAARCKKNYDLPTDRLQTINKSTVFS